MILIIPLQKSDSDFSKREKKKKKKKNQLYRTGVGKLQPIGHMQPLKT